MYKTITHKTTEEHYINGVLVKPTMIGDSLPTVVINERTMNFRMDNRTLWTRYSLGMINFSVALYGGMVNSDNVLENLKKAGQACGDYFIPYYGFNAAKKIGSLLIVIAINGSKVAEALKAKRDIAAFETIWDKQINELATYLNELNPQHCGFAQTHLRPALSRFVSRPRVATRILGKNEGRKNAPRQEAKV